MRNQRLFSIIVFTLTLVTSNLVNAQSQSPFKNWLATENQKHPLVGKIWSTAERKFITNGELISRLAIRDYILLGETHDNPDHHRLQGWVITKVVRYDRKPAIIMEMIDRDQAGELATYMSDVKARRQKQPATNFGTALRWEERGWPEWKIYQPVATSFFTAKLRVYPGNPSREELQAIRKNGFTKLEKQRKKELALDTDFLLSVQNAMKVELSKSHCDLLPFSALEPMANIQRYKDAILAESMIKGSKKQGSLLIAGSGHIRNDRGVPYYIKQRENDANIITLSFIEVEAGNNTPDEHIPATTERKAAVDYVWFTPGQTRKDPCVALKMKFKKKS